ncbi:MAG TPA: heme-binding protein [Blastocatellia bacterium]|nr:heme-binding protein [Blastocatellia bacterium]
MAIFKKEKPVPTANGVTLELAQQIITAAVRKAKEIGVMQNIAIVDEGNNLVAFARMDGAWQGSIDIAINKAYTARAFDMPSADLGKIAQPGEMCFGIHVSNNSRVIIFGGGIPIQRGGKIIGAIGVSGGTVDQDVEVAEAGIEAFEQALSS